jgi:hypothetical protein
MKTSIYHKMFPAKCPECGHRFKLLFDVYRVLRAFGVTDHNLGHAIKKLLCPGQRSGGKSARQDVHEAGRTIQNWEEMNEEDEP